MKFELPEIAWHGTQPIYACDFQTVSNDSDFRLATAGADNDVKLWKIWCYEGQLKIEVLSILSDHKRSANCVKFCPVLLQNQPVLASCDDDGVVCLWTKCDDKEKYAASFLDEETDLNKEYWKVTRTLRGHIEEVQDLCWNSDGTLLLSGSIDTSARLWQVSTGQCLHAFRESKGHIEEVQDLCWNSDGTLLLSGSIDTSARLWQVSTGQCLHAFRESKGLVQGVAIDPLGKFIATFADDKSVRMYHATNKRCAYRNTKFVFDDKAVKLFGDTGDGFFHRICFSPHGEFFVVPSGSFPISAESSIFCTYVYCRDNLSKPVLYLPSGRRPSVSVSFCPIKFKYRNETENSENVRPNLFNLSYRLVFAVITENSVLFYDTERFEVFAKVENIHYASLNSGSWCKDGTMFVATSSDGYATICTFEESELGEKVTEAEIAFQTVQTPQSTPIVNCDAKVSQDDENLLTSNSAEILKEEENSEKKEDDEIERLDNQKPESKNLPLVAEAKIATSNHSENGPSTPSKMETHLNNKQQQIIDLDKTPTNEKQGLLSVNTSQPSTPVSRNGKGKLAPLALKTILKPASPAELKTNSPAVSPKNVSFSPKMKQRLVPTKSKTNASSKKQNTHKSKNIDTSSNQIASAFARGSRILAESLKNQKAEDARPQSDPNNPIFIDDDSIPEVVPSSGPLIDKSNEINLVSPGSNLSSAPTTPKSILKTPSPDSPMPSEGSKKRRVSFRTLELPPCKESKKEESEQQSCSVEKTAEESKSSQPVPGKKRKIAFTTIS